MERSVAIVGSRAATAYGNGIAADLAADLVEYGVSVVSGGAFGIDVAAHRGALGAGGPTVGVLANGVDVAYPPADATLFETLGKEQLLVSELPPGAHPTRVRFLVQCSDHPIQMRARRRGVATETLGTSLHEVH
jgi:DNA processing protein